MPDESQRPEYDTHERLTTLVEECRVNLVTVSKAVETACGEKEDLGKLAVGLVTDTYRTALLADDNDVGADAARKILAGYIKILTANTSAIETNVAKVRLIKAERMRVVMTQLDKIVFVAAAHKDPSRELLRELGDLGETIRSYNRAVTQGFNDVEWCEDEFIKRTGIIFGDEIAAEGGRKPKSAVLETLRQTYETQIEEIGKRRRETKIFTESKNGITEYDTLKEVLKAIAEEEAELEVYLDSRGM